ncbi:V-SNARE coiled-coil homology domain-containing protein, partial [Haematococcus lacustris]
CVCVVDLSQPALLWCLAPLPQQQPILSTQVVHIAPPAKKDRASGMELEEEGGAVATLLLATADACLAALDLNTGAFIGRHGALQPKNQSQALTCHPLDAQHRLLWQASAQGRCSQDALALARAANLAATKRTAPPASARKPSSDDGSSEDGSRVPLAEYVLLTTDHYIRIYSMQAVVAGDRAVSAKLPTSTPLVWAATLHVNGAPGVVAMAQAEASDPVTLQVYSLPGLDLLADMPLMAALEGTHIEWQPPAGSVAKIARAVTASPLGHLLLLGPQAELIQLAVTP